MNRTRNVLTAVFLGLATALILAPPLAAQEVHSLRGATTIKDTAQVHDVKRQNTDAGKMKRAYRQQPPMIPHKIDGYQIDLKANKCMRCHDWPYNTDEQATKISETHYINREGVALDRVARTRWFCTQCHVPQVNARALVRNTFKSSIEVD